MSARSDLCAQALAAAAQLQGSARAVGVPGAVVGRHIAGPTRGRSVVMLEYDLATILRGLVDALDEAREHAIKQVAHKPTAASAIPTSGARFRNLEID